MINYKSYLFEFSYGNRTEELGFITGILNKFDSETLTGITLLVNNNIYNLEFLLLLFFDKKSEQFDNWLIDTYPSKKTNLKFNYSTSEIIKNQLNGRCYNSFLFTTIDQLKSVLTENPNHIFMFQESKKIEELWGKSKNIKKTNIFLSHSSTDKALIEYIFSELQKVELNVWFDKYEIDFGDSISDKINHGLNKSDLGLICLSKSFLSSNWAKSEMNYFIQQRINKGINFICIILDLEHSEIPPLLQDYRYITLKDEDWIEQLISSIKRKESA